MSNKFLTKNITIGDVDELQTSLNSKLDKYSDQTFSGILTIQGNSNISSTNPFLILNKTDNSANEKKIKINQDTDFKLSLESDDDLTSTPFFITQRTGTTIDKTIIRGDIIDIGQSDGTLHSKFENKNLNIYGNVNVSGNVNSANVLSGTYQATSANISGCTNLNSNYTAQYMRVGNVVNVSGKIDITTTGSSIKIFSLDVPIASTITTAAGNLGGSIGSGNGFHGNIQGNSNQAYCYLDYPLTSHVATGYQYHYTYSIN